MYDSPLLCCAHSLHHKQTSRTEQVGLRMFPDYVSYAICCLVHEKNTTDSRIISFWFRLHACCNTTYLIRMNAVTKLIMLRNGFITGARMSSAFPISKWHLRLLWSFLLGVKLLGRLSQGPRTQLIQNTQYALPFRIVCCGLLAMAKNGSVAPEYEGYAMSILCTHIKLWWCWC